MRVVLTLVVLFAASVAQAAIISEFDRIGAGSAWTDGMPGLLSIGMRTTSTVWDSAAAHWCQSTNAVLDTVTFVLFGRNENINGYTWPKLTAEDMLGGVYSVHLWQDRFMGTRADGSAVAKRGDQVFDLYPKVSDFSQLGWRDAETPTFTFTVDLSAYKFALTEGQEYFIAVRRLGHLLTEGMIYTSVSRAPDASYVDVYATTPNIPGTYITELDPPSPVPHFGVRLTVDTLESNAVPEPSSLALLSGLGVMGLIAARRRRKKVA